MKQQWDEWGNEKGIWQTEQAGMYFLKEENWWRLNVKGTDARTRPLGLKPFAKCITGRNVPQPLWVSVSSSVK